MIDTFVDSLVIDKVERHENLEVMFLKSDLASDIDIFTFDEMRHFVDISEVKDGEVPFLSLHNRSPYKIICLSGTLLSGCFQDRTIKTGFVLHPHQETKISVFCVQQGRWKDKISKGIKSRYHLSSDIRKNLRTSAQGDVWRKIKEKADRMRVKSRTDNIQDIYEARMREMKAFQTTLECSPEHVGIITLINSRVTSGEFFAIKGLYPKVHDSILTGHIIDALDEELCQKVSNHKPLTVEAFLKAIKETKRDYIEQSANGRIITLESSAVVGDGLVDDGVLLEFEAYAR